MSDDALAKAAYDAHAAACGMQGVLDWDELTPHQQVAWRAAARAVLEAAGVGELVALVALVREFGEWVEIKRDDCVDAAMPDVAECDERCPHWSTCNLPKLAQRIATALARAGEYHA